MSKASRDDDLIGLIERMIALTEDAGEDAFPIPTHMARALLEMAKRAPASRGGQRTKGRERVREAVALALTRKRKKELAQGMPKGEAHDKAAEETEAKLRKRRNLAASTIKRRSQRRH